MAYPKNSNGHYLIPSQEGETRIEADCSGCGSGWNVPERVWEWFSFCHAREHNKGHNGLAAMSDMNVRRFELGKSAQQEPEAAE